MIPSLRMLRVPLLLFGILLANSVADAQQLIGTYTVYYRFNAGGCYGGGDPYFCSYIPPGPIHIDAAAGRYRVEVVQVNNAASGGGGLAVWDGDATGGMQYSTGGMTIDFDHKFGQITLYYNDWYPFDNDPNAWTVANLYQLSGTGALKLNLDQQTVVPSNAYRGQIPPQIIATVTLTDATGQPIGGSAVQIESQSVDMTTAGHNHSNIDVVDQFSQGAFVGAGGNTCTTDSSGICSVNLVSPEISGSYKIKASSSSLGLSDVAPITVAYSGLTLLAASNWYRQTGQQPAHLTNHYGTSNLAAKVSSLSEDYSAISLLIHGRVESLGVNDMSLVNGGLFDINGDWDSPHNLHRSGTSVDIDRSVELTGGQVVPTNLLLLELLARVLGLTKVPEATIHYESSN